MDIYCRETTERLESVRENLTAETIGRVEEGTVDERQA